jgi:uncharacterized membrane protein YhaH (DUF805 family)
MNPIDLLFGFQGRIGRGQFWLAVLFWTAVFLLAIVLGILISTSLEALLSAALILYILLVILFVPVGVKRLHDRNKRGWWLALFFGFPTATLLLSPLVADEEPMAELPLWILIVQYIGLAIFLWALVELGLIRGTIGVNPHGPDPVAPKPAKH